MGVIRDVSREVPLTALLRERLVDQEKKMTVTETENAALGAENTVLKAENRQLRLRLQDAQASETVQQNTCPYCRQPKGQLLRLVPHETFGDLGSRIGYYKCTQCGKEYHRKRNP